MRPAPVVLRGAPGNGKSTWTGSSPAREFAQASTPFVSATTFEVTYSGLPTAGRTAFQAALNYWAGVISSPVPIKIAVTFEPLKAEPGSALPLGRAGAVDSFMNAAHFIPYTFYPSALANKIAGQDLDPDAGDIEATFNSNVSWDYGTDTSVPADRYNFYTVALHEIGHGLGFAGSMTRNNATGIGRWGNNTEYPGIFDRCTRTGAGRALLSIPNGSKALGDALVSGNVIFTGARTTRARLHAPSSFDEGSSYSHLAESTYPRGNANALMTPLIGLGEGIGAAGSLALNILRDIGWGPGAGCGAAHDLTGDGANDVLARKTTGELYVYPGSGSSGFKPPAVIATGFDFFDEILLTRDLSGDGSADVVGRAKSDGRLWLYKGNGAGRIVGPFEIGTGWNAFDELVAPGDFNGDGKSDLIGRKPDGTLWLYRGDGASGWLGSGQIGSGWGRFDELLAPGDFSGDRKSDLIGRKSDGTMWLYRGNGTGRFIDNGAQIGAGWSGFTALVTPGDWSGDNLSDVLARKADGTLWMYRGNGASRWISPYPRIGSGWNGFDIIR